MLNILLLNGSNMRSVSWFTVTSCSSYLISDFNDRANQQQEDFPACGRAVKMLASSKTAQICIQHIVLAKVVTHY